MKKSTDRKLGIEEIIGNKRGEILRLAAAHKAHHVRVFGSVARGEARPESDVDFLVEFDADYTLIDHAGLLVDLQELLGRKVDVVNEPFLRKEYEAYVKADAKPL